MKNILQSCIMILVTIVLLTPAVRAEELTKGEMDTIYIAALKVQPSVSEAARKKRKLTELKRVSDSLETQLISALNAVRVFQLVEQERAADAAQVQVQESAEDAAADDSKSAATARTAGAKFAFIPQIDGFEDKSDITEFQATGRASLNRRLFLSATVRIVDTASGKMLSSSPAIQLTRSEEIENARSGQLAGSDETIVALAREMAAALSREVASRLRPAKVLAVTGRQVLFNRGSDAGFNKGDLVEFFTVQSVKDEDSGELFRNEVPVGQAIINRIDKSQSYATISGDDSGIVKGCVVRFAKSAAVRAAEKEDPADVTIPDFGAKGDSGTTPGSSEKPLKWK